MPRKRKEIPELEKMLQYGKKKFVRYDEGAKLYSMGLRWEDVDFEHRSISVMKPGSVNRAIRIISDDYNEVETEKAKEEGREPVLLPHFSAHHLRHTFCTRLCENGSNLKFIQSVMGHADISTTMDIYAEATEEKKQEIIGGLRGKIL